MGVIFYCEKQLLLLGNNRKFGVGVIFFRQNQILLLGNNWNLGVGGWFARRKPVSQHGVENLTVDPPLFLDPKGVKMAIFEKSLKNLLDGSINIICA